jgi:outer membrane protein assembly factor BamE (lipoprotein component of BamABCDE complex)
MKNLLFLILFSLLCGCVKNINQKGYILDNNDLSNVKVGLTSKENALRYLGYPLNKSHFNDDIWIYYSYKTKEVLFFKPKLMEQKVLIVEFDNETNLVKNMKLHEIDSNNAKILENTSTNAEEEDILKDLFRNIGQVGM